MIYIWASSRILFSYSTSLLPFYFEVKTCQSKLWFNLDWLQFLSKSQSVWGAYQLRHWKCTLLVSAHLILLNSERFYQCIVDENLYSSFDLIIEHLNDKGLICSPYIVQSKWHNFVLKNSTFSYEINILLVIWMHKNLIIARKGIEDAHLLH